MEAAVMEALAQQNPEAWYLEDFGFALMGYVEAANSPPRALYNAAQILDHLASTMPYERALDFFHTNINGACCGANSPLFYWSVE